MALSGSEKIELKALLFNESGTTEGQGLLIKAKGQFLDDRSATMKGRIAVLVDQI